MVAGAVDFVLDSQLPDGTFERGWTVSESSAIQRVLDALHVVRPVDPAVADRITEATRRAVDRLATTQHADGGWGQQAGSRSDVLSTAQALPILARPGERSDAARGLAYLVAHQEDDGGFVAPPDQVGPRPLPFDFPVLTDIHTLTALNRTRDLLDAARPRAVRRGSTNGSDWSALAAGLKGVLLRLEQAAYEQARLLVNQRFDGIRPQAIAYPAAVEDVVECVNFARQRRIPLTLRSGGHSYAGYSTGVGLVLDVSSLNSAVVGAGRAEFGAGVKGMQAHLALAAAGAGLPLGRCPTIGLAGVTLGGGLSAFTRAWGLACDHLRSVEIVTADNYPRLQRVKAAYDPGRLLDFPQAIVPT